MAVKTYPTWGKMIRNMGLAVLVLLTLQLIFTLPAEAQIEDLEPVEVTAGNTFDCGGKEWVVQVKFWNVGALGGEPYAQASLIGDNCINGKLVPPEMGAMQGRFSGGPNGILTMDYCLGAGNSSNCRTVEWQLVEGKYFTLQGNIHFIVQNPEAFDPKPITAEYIFTTYGIQVLDSFDEAGYEPTSWTNQELRLLDEVLRELPPAIRNSLALSRIVRNKVGRDQEGNLQPSWNGVYSACGSPPQKDCSSSSGVIRIFDRAFTPNLLSNDPDGKKKFKAVILHEMIHAHQYFKDDQSMYRNALDSPVLQNWMDATRNVTDIYDPGFKNVDNGWIYGSFPNTPPQWILWEPKEDNKPPTSYGSKNPLEDMSDSVMMYVYDPDKLKATSMKRYTYICDYLYQGVEYENGIRK